MSENRHSPLIEFKLAGAEATGTFSGFASTFGGTPDSYGDIVSPGAFAETLAAHKTAGTFPALLWQHDATSPIGRWLDLRETQQGLEVSGRLTLATQRGSEAHALMKDGALALSIGFRIPQGGATYQGSNRLLKNVDLVEISTVALPANPAAKIVSVKSSGAILRPENIREFEAALRDACGFSVREAKRIASAGWPALHRRDDGSDELEQIAAMFKQAATQFKS